MNFSSNRYGALDQLFDFDIAMTANGYNNGGSNNPSSMSYSPEAASLLNSAVYNPTGAARANNGGADLSPTANGGYQQQHHHHHHHHTTTTSSNNAPAHHTLLTASANSAAAAPYSPTGAASYFGSSAAGNTNTNSNSFSSTPVRGLSPFGGNSTSTNAAVAANTALRQMAAAAFEPIPIRHQQGSSSQPPASRHADQGRSPLEELLMLGTSAYLNPTPSAVAGPASSFDLAGFTDPFLSRPANAGPVRSSTNTTSRREEEEEEWMKEINLTVPSLSLEPIHGAEVIRRIRSCMEDVIRRYIPCVDFLVQCQQELRKGLAAAQIKHSGRRYRQAAMTPNQFWKSYIENLPNRFFLTNERRMEHAALQEAVQGLHKLKSDSQQAVHQGCEAVKNSFLGGMKEGASWGLRKWLSKNGNALRVCTDLECMLKACKELDKSKETTKKLAGILRPLAKQTLDKLKKDVPASYQERSTAHPYLPFFHRLEGALRNMSQFDPEDDGVICLDDSDDDDDPIIVVPPPKRKAAPRKRKAETHTIDISEPPQKRVFEEANAAAETEAETEQDKPAAITKSPSPAPPPTPPPLENPGGALTFVDDGSSSGESDEDSVIQIVAQAVARDNNVDIGDVGGWTCTNCSARNPSAAVDTCQECGEPSYNSDLVGTLFSPAFGDDLDLNSVDRSGDEAISFKPKKSKKKKGRSTGMNETSHRYPFQVGQEELNVARGIAQSLATKAERLAFLFESMDPSSFPSAMKRARKKESLWDDLYSTALRIFSELLRQPDAVHFVEQVNENDLTESGHPRYSEVIKNPLCFRDILSTLTDLEHMDEEHSDHHTWYNGILPSRGLAQWNMWRGSDLLQAIDLVFLNSLAYGKMCGEGRSKHRSRTNDLRKQLWAQIHDNVSACVDDPERRRRSTPTRRSETSGFVLYKEKVG